MPHSCRALFVLSALGLLFVPVGGARGETPDHEPMEPSSGAVMNRYLKLHPARAADAGVTVETAPAEIPGEGESGFRGGLAPFGFTSGTGLDDFSYLDNGSENNGLLFIPPDPKGTAGLYVLMSVVNVAVICREKNGGFIWRDGLKSFFSPLGGASLGTYCFDPKVVYDPYQDRFIVVALEQTAVLDGDAADASRILIAVSQHGGPSTSTTSDWYFAAIDSKLLISGQNYWADYPGLVVDEEAVYITANMFNFSLTTQRERLWIVNKGVSGGLYGGGAISASVVDPIGSTAGTVMTMMPALAGAGGAGPGIGTYLIGYDGFTNGGPGMQEKLQIIRVNNPLGSPTFTKDVLLVGDLENVGGTYGIPSLPDAPQLGSAHTIEVNDRRVLDAVWRSGSLWVTTTINPNPGYDAVNAGQTTAHWFRLDTSAVTSSASPGGLITLADQGDIGGEDVAAGASTFFPAVAVNGSGDAMFGFSASASTIYPGAYYAGRLATYAPGTVAAKGTVKAGVDWYFRTFGNPRNRWGDYSGVSVDPADERIFWIYNEYAMLRGSASGGEDGRWRTAWRAAAASCLSVACPGDTLAPAGGTISLQFCVTNCGALQENFTYTVSDQAGWCTPASGPLTVAGGATSCVAVNCSLPPDACAPDSTVIKFKATSPSGEADSCLTVVRGFCPLGPVLAVSPSSVVFPTVAAGDTVCDTLVVRNVGDADMTILSVTGCGSSGFSLDLSGLASPVPAGESTTVVVCFSPLSADPETCAVAVATADSTASVPVSVGTVTAVPDQRPGGARVIARVIPNPFRDESRIVFALPAAGFVRVSVFDAQGRLVRTVLAGERPAGAQEAAWDGRDARGVPTPGGMYFIRVEGPAGSQVVRAVRVR